LCPKDSGDYGTGAPGTELDLSHAIKMAIGHFDISMLLDAEIFNPSPCVRSNPTVPGKCRSNGGAAIGSRTCLACKKHDRDRQRRTRERRRKRTGGLATNTTVVVTPNLLRSASISQMLTALQDNGRRPFTSMRWDPKRGDQR
jgi:hypothetical protein